MAKRLNKSSKLCKLTLQYQYEQPTVINHFVCWDVKETLYKEAMRMSRVYPYSFNPSLLPDGDIAKAIQTRRVGINDPNIDYCNIKFGDYTLTLSVLKDTMKNRNNPNLYPHSLYAPHYE